MIQATDFVCPTCHAQVGKPCTNKELVYSYGRSVFKTVPRFGKPHAERRLLARVKRLSTQAPAIQDAQDKDGS